MERLAPINQQTGLRKEVLQHWSHCLNPAQGQGQPRTEHSALVDVLPHETNCICGISPLFTFLVHGSHEATSCDLQENRLPKNSGDSDSSIGFVFAVMRNIAESYSASKSLDAASHSVAATGGRPGEGVVSGEFGSAKPEAHSAATGPK